MYRLSERMWQSAAWNAFMGVLCLLIDIPATIAFALQRSFFTCEGAFFILLGLFLLVRSFRLRSKSKE